MRVGIIAEYNPFHNGHLYHLNEAKKLTQATELVVALSGSLVQRGECALLSKWARAEMAVEAGADLVVELPVIYSCASAELFAQGAVSTLKALGIDSLAFGAECDDVECLCRSAAACDDRDFNLRLKSELKKGSSFPAARAAALPPEDSEILSHPNNILAVEYIRAGAPKPTVIPRKGVRHDAAAPSGEFAGASYIRELILSNRIAEAAKFMPDSSFKILSREIEKGRAPIATERLELAILSRIRQMKAEEIAPIADVGEGLEGRIKSAAQLSGDLETLYFAIKTKRYTLSRVRRILLNLMLEITSDMQRTKPSCVRVLALGKGGGGILKESALPVVTKRAGADFLQLEKESRASDLAALASPHNRSGGSDFLHSPFILRQ